MGFRELDIKNEYRSLIDDVVNDFYIPLLRGSVFYQRAVGFFSSSALVMLAKGIDGLVQNGGKIQVIASPRLSENDIEEIKKGYAVREIITNALIREIRDVTSEHEIQRLSYIAQLIAQGTLDIKIAFLSANNEISLYHEKMGIMTDASGDSVAFSGSMNETENAFHGNYEAFDVFCSWTADSSRVFQKKMAFQAIWEDYEPGIETLAFPDAVKSELYKYNPQLAKTVTVRKPSSTEVENHPVSEGPDKMHLPADFVIRDYQEQAIESWKSNHYRGIYDMATGTGKTLTALASVEQLYRDNGDRLAIIILCPYQHLVEQWVEDIVRFGIHPIIGYSKSPQKHWKKNLEQAVRSFNLQVSNLLCFITTNASFITSTIQNQINLLSKDTVFVVDEAHNLGAGTYRKYLPEQIVYRLALSATIDRHNDESGTQALIDYFGPKCIAYSLREAIANNMLTPYYYHPVITYLYPEELDDYLTITHQLAKFLTKKKGKIVLSEQAKQLLIKRSRIIAGARDKLDKLAGKITPFIHDKHILVYCGATTVKDSDDDLAFSMRQIDLVADLLGNRMQMRVGRFTSQETPQERMQIREAFADGDVLQALVAIKCLDEGVNIPSIKTAFILASSTNPKEYIQRRGRVLRKFPGKTHADIYDFVTLPFSKNTLNNQSSDTINSSKGLIRRELIRMLDFAEIAENPSETYKLVFELKQDFGITEEELNGEEVKTDAV